MGVVVATVVEAIAGATVDQWEDTVAAVEGAGEEVQEKATGKQLMVMLRIPADERIPALVSVRGRFSIGFTEAGFAPRHPLFSPHLLSRVF